MKNKEKQLLKEFNKKWSDDRKIIEKELAYEISKCKALTKSMDEIVDMLKDKESIIAAKELEVCLCILLYYIFFIMVFD